MIKVGDTLPDATLMEYSEVEGNGCSIGPNPVKVKRGHRRQDHRGVRAAGRLHAHLLGQARAGLRARSSTS
jgi:hypothetical protein